MAHRRRFWLPLVLGAMLVGSAGAQEPEWVEIESFEESYVLSPEAESVTWNARTYRYEVGGTRHYSDQSRLVLQAWSSDFQPMVMVREARSEQGQAGHGEILVRGQNRLVEDNGTHYFISEIQFLPPEDGPYRLILTSAEPLSDSKASMGGFQVAWTLSEWQVPAAPQAPPRADVAGAASVGCTMGWHPGMGPGETGYFGLWSRDMEDTRMFDRFIRVAEGPFTHDRAQNAVSRGIAQAYPGTFIGMHTGEEICQYVADNCAAAEAFTATCGPLGFAAMPDRRVSR